MKVLIGCEFSGITRTAFRELGHDAWSCDFSPSEDSSPYHITGDLLAILDNNWDLLIAHPPCTYLCHAGVKHLYHPLTKDLDGERWEKMKLAADFFMKIWSSPISRICIENPAMHKYAKRYAGIPQANQIIQPWQFGHGEVKKSLLWLKNLPLLRSVRAEKEREARIHRMGPANRSKERSRSFPGIAQAMASQWGSL